MGRVGWGLSLGRQAVIIMCLCRWTNWFAKGIGIYVRIHVYFIDARSFRSRSDNGASLMSTRISRATLEMFGDVLILSLRQPSCGKPAKILFSRMLHPLQYCSMRWIPISPASVPCFYPECPDPRLLILAPRCYTHTILLQQYSRL